MILVTASQLALTYGLPAASPYDDSSFDEEFESLDGAEGGGEEDGDAYLHFNDVLRGSLYCAPWAAAHKTTPTTNQPPPVVTHEFLAAERLIREGARKYATIDEEDAASLVANKIILSGLTTVSGLHRAQKPARRLMTDSGRKAVVGNGRLSDMNFAHVRSVITHHLHGTPIDNRPIYTAALILPMTDWNGYGNALGNVMKNVLYLVAREFFASGETDIDAFCQALTSTDLLREYEKTEGQTTLKELEKDRTDLKNDVGGVTTVVNQVMIALQLHSLDVIEPFLKRLHDISKVAFQRLVERRQELEQKPREKWSTKDHEDAEKLSLMLDGISVDADGNVFYTTRKKGTFALGVLGLDLIRAGASQYNTELDSDPNFLRQIKAYKINNKNKINLVWVNRESQRMRDEAIKHAEYAASHREEGLLFFNLPQALTREELAWRDGAYLRVPRILRALHKIVADTADDNPAMRRYQADSRGSSVLGKRQQALATRPQKDMRVFKGVSFEDLITIATPVAQFYLEGYLAEHGPSVTGETMANDLSNYWLQTLAEPEAYENGDVVCREFAHALQLMFLEKITDGRLLALYHEIGGYIEPQRLQRLFGNLEAEIDFIVTELYYFDWDQESSQAQFDILRARYENVLEEAAFLMDIAGHDLRNGTTRPRELVAAAAHQATEAHYQKLDALGIHVPEKERGYWLIAYEIKNAKVLDREINPVTELHVVDKNMVPIATIPEDVASQFYPFTAGEIPLPILNPSDPESYVQADEGAGFNPAHTADGSRLDLSRYNVHFRHYLKQLFPQEDLHYNHKQDPPEGGTLRLKLWRTSGHGTIHYEDDEKRSHTIEISSTDQLVIATHKEAFSQTPSDEQRFWIVEINGKALKKPILGGRLTDDRFTLESAPEKVVGPASVRLCAIFIPLRPKTEKDGERRELTPHEIVALLNQRLELAMDLDAEIKKKDGSDTGVWVYNINTEELEHVDG